MSTEHSHKQLSETPQRDVARSRRQGSPDAEPPIDLDTMLELTANASVDVSSSTRVDLFLYDPHVSIDIDDDGIKRLADKILFRGFVVVRWSRRSGRPTGGGSAMGSDDDRKRFLEQVEKRANIAQKTARAWRSPYGVVRIDSASGVEIGPRTPRPISARIIETFTEACDIAETYGERLAAEGEICWGGIHSWKKNGRFAGTRESAANAGLPGRHGPHASLHPRLQRPRRPPFCPQIGLVRFLVASTKR